MKGLPGSLLGRSLFALPRCPTLYATRPAFPNMPKQVSLFGKVQLRSVLRRFYVAHLNYLEFADILDRSIPHKRECEGDETLTKLLTGAASEFRSYCGAQPTAATHIHADAQGARHALVT